MTRQVLDWKVLVKHILQQKSKTQNLAFIRQTEGKSVLLSKNVKLLIHSRFFSFAKFPFQNLLDHPV